jgi:hypothetical protein
MQLPLHQIEAATNLDQFAAQLKHADKRQHRQQEVRESEQTHETEKCHVEVIRREW